MTFYYDDNRGTDRFTLQDFEPSFGAKLDATVSEAWLESYGPTAVDFVRKNRDDGKPKLSADEVKTRIAESGLKPKITPKDGEYSEDQLSVVLERQRELAKAKDVRERTPWDWGSPIRGVAMFGAGIADPINLATAFVPWTKLLPVAASLRAAALSSSAATRFAGRAGFGAADAGISTALLEPAYAYARRDLGDDYDALDSLANIAFGTAFGGGIHSLGGAGVDQFRRMMGRAQPFDRFQGLSVDQIVQVQALDNLSPAEVQATIAGFSPEMRRAAGFPDVDPNAVPPPAAGMVTGLPARVRMGEAFEPAQWTVVDADELTATVDKADNQFRDRNRAAYQAEIQARANALDPTQVLSTDNPLMDVGTPTISADGKIIGGNGRTLFIQRAYEIGKGAEYRAALEAKLADLGIDPTAVQDMKKPVLVRRLTNNVDVKKAAMLSNEGGSTAMSPLEQAKVDAERIGTARLETDADGNLDTAGNRAAIRKWVNEQPEGQRNALMTEDGMLSATGLQRLRNAVLFKAYGDSPILARLIEATDPGSRNVAAALARTAGKVAEAQDMIGRGELHPLSIADDIRMAVEQFDALRRQGTRVSEYLAQIDAFGDPLTPEARLLLDALSRNISSSRRMGDIISGYYDRLGEAGNPGQGDMFGGAAPDKLSMLDAAIRAAESTLDTAAETIARVDPETREAALRASVAQSAEGRVIEVDAIVKTDPAAGTATANDVLDAAQTNQKPEAIRTADFESSAMVDERNAAAPKWDGVTDAENALNEADTILNDTIKAGEDAYKYSRGEAPADPGTVDTLTTALRTSFGSSTDSLLEAGQVRVVNEVADILGGPHPADVKGATLPDGTVYMVARNITPDEARGMLLHEVGTHVGMRTMLGDDLFNDVLNQLDEAIARGDDWAKAARASVPADTPANLVREEQLGYLVQNSPELTLVKRIVAAVRVWAYKNFEFARERIKLTDADFRSMAVSALHHAARGGDQAGAMATAFSRAQTATKAFKDWFGGSKVVDDNGEPRVGYHGTSANVTTFRPGRYGLIFVSPDPAFASRYAGAEWTVDVEGGSPNVMPVYVKADNPFNGKNPSHVAQVAKLLNDPDAEARLSSGMWELLEEDDIVNAIRRSGFDAMAVTEQGVENLAVFSPTQLKSATGNRGTFDPGNPDIRYSRGPTLDPSNAADELKPFDEAVKRAKAMTAVLRAAADKLDNEAQAAAAMKAAMPDVTTAEIADLLAQLRSSVKGLRGMARSMGDALTAEDRAGILQSDAMRAADTLANNLVMAAVIEKRNAALNLNARLKAASFVNQFRAKGLDFEGFAALLVGSERVRTGARISIDSEAKAFRGEWVGGMIADVEKLGLMREFTSGAFDKDIYDALWRMGQKNADMAGLSPEAVKMAEVINKYQTDARNTRNRFGAWIRDLQGYITRQSHDMFKIREVADKDWIDFVLPRLDIQKMTRLGLISADDPVSSLRAIYDDFAAGVHMKAQAGEADTVALGRGANLAKRESVSRSLYFKDGVAAYEYNTRFGSGRLAESVLQGLDGAARSAALLKNLGTNPEVALTRLLDDYENSLVGEPARRETFRGQRKQIMNMLSHVDGTANIPGNVTAAKVGSFLRALQSMAKLGGAVISSVTDLAGYAAEMRYAQDKNLLSGVTEGIGKLIEGRPKGERAEVLASLGVFHESVLGSVAARFDSPDLVGGKMAAAMQMFFKFNGLAWWTESLRDGAALSQANYLASNTGKAWDKVPDELKRMLQLYNIDAGKWDILRMATMQEADGRAYMTPDALRTVPRSALENYITQVGRTPNDATVANLVDDLSQALRVMAIDRAHHAILEPGARTRAFMLRGTQPGTVPGEILRYIGQFKSFSVAMIQMTLGREIYGRGYDTLGEYLRKGHGDMLGLASYIALTGAMGYAAMSIKDLLKGKEPRPVDDPRTWAAALIQGGGLGLYGDFLFGEYNRMGRTFTASAVGPVAGVVDTAFDLFTRARRGDDLAGAALNAALQNTPFMNLFYVRPVLDYLIIYRLQEAINPGYLRRMERRVERENGQSFILPPSQFAR